MGLAELEAFAAAYENSQQASADPGPEAQEDEEDMGSSRRPPSARRVRIDESFNREQSPEPRKERPRARSRRGKRRAAANAAAGERDGVTPLVRPVA